MTDRYDAPTSGPWWLSCVGSCTTEKKQQLAVGNLRRIVHHLDRLGVPGGFGGDLVVGGGLRRTAGVSRRSFHHALHALKDRLRAPEASSRKDGSLLARRGGQRSVELGGRDRRTGRRGVRCRTTHQRDHGAESQNEPK